MVLFSILLRTSNIKRHECPQLPSHIMILEAKEDADISILIASKDQIGKAIAQFSS